MPIFSFMARFGARLVANGYPIIPIQPGTKKPGCHRGGGWHDYPAWTRHAARATTDLELQLWSAWPDAGVGIVGGSVAAVDIDIADDAELALRIERLARERLGDTPALRIGRAPKRLLVYRAAQMASNHEPCSREVSMAKLFGSETLKSAALTGMQVLGGYANLPEADMERYLRESIQSTIGGGTSQIQKTIIAKSMRLA